MSRAPAMVVLLAACRPEAPASAPAPPVEAPAAVVPPAVAGDAELADGFCYLEIVELGRRGPATAPLLRDRMASTAIVTLVTQTLAKSDCTSIGHHHVVFEPLSPADGSGLVRAYRSLDLPTNPGFPRTAHYLLGADVMPERDLDLSHVCVPWQGRINATPQWVVPIADERELPLWRTRLAEGLCGRAPLVP